MAPKPKKSAKKKSASIPRGWWVGAAHLYEPSKKSLKK